jgi:thioesterase-3
MLSKIFVQVKPEDIDSMGHMNNSKYLKYLTLGRTDWYLKAGYPMERFFESDLGRVVVNICINFHKEALEGEKLLIVTSVKSYRKSSFVLYQEIFNERNQIISDANVTNVIFNRKTRKSEEIPAKLLSFIEKSIRVLDRNE